MSDLSKEKKKELSKAWQEAQCRDYLLTEENVQELFEYLEEQLKDLPDEYWGHISIVKPDENFREDWKASKSNLFGLCKTRLFLLSASLYTASAVAV